MQIRCKFLLPSSARVVVTSKCFTFTIIITIACTSSLLFKKIIQKATKRGPIMIVHYFLQLSRVCNVAV